MKRLRRRVAFVFAVILIPPLLWGLGVRGLVMQWGTTGDEATRPLVGDSLIASAERVTTRALTVAAPPEAVFPWITQLGAGRAGFYSHVWLERAIGCDLTNGEAIDPSWQMKTGDVVRLCPEGSGPPIVYVVKELTPPRVRIPVMPNTYSGRSRTSGDQRLTTLVGGYFVGFFPFVKAVLFRIDSPRSTSLCALWTSRSQIESATVASPMAACHWSMAS